MIDLDAPITQQQFGHLVGIAQPTVSDCRRLIPANPESSTEEKRMSAKTVTVPMPPALSHERLSDPNYTIHAISPKGPVLAHYDPVMLAGGICYLVGDLWAIYGPLPFGEFVASLGGRGIQIDDSDDLARWVMACTALPNGIIPN